MRGVTKDLFLIPATVDAAAQQHPESDAAVFLNECLSYADLAGRSNALAHCLTDAGVKRGDRVGIYMDKCLDVPVALYGIMKAGAAYVPLDPSAPAQRVAGVARDCGIRVIVTSNAMTRRLRALVAAEAPVDCLVGLDSAMPGVARTTSWSEVYAYPAISPPAVKIVESDLAYIIYTSGSTGTPKGIMHTHRSGLSFARWAVDEYGFHRNDRLSNHAPLHFDLSILDFFSTAVAGATTVIIPEEHTKLPASYSQLLADARVTVLYTVPFALIALLMRGVLSDRDLSALRWVLFGGEPLSGKHLRRLMRMWPQARFDNIYGPAEVNGCSHHTVVSPPMDDNPVAIGPIANIAEALIVDSDDQPVAIGDSGELLVRTPTMMQGYWARPNLNARVFYTVAGEGGMQQVFFRTGDLVRQDAEGVLTFLGRKDRQIKMRGYRVELDEVEAALTADNAVEEAAAFALPDASGSNRIHAAVTLVSGHQTTSTQLSAALKGRLPWYALPAVLGVVEGFPRTTTGKIDRRALRAAAEAADATERAPPSEPAEANTP